MGHGLLIDPTIRTKKMRYSSTIDERLAQMAKARQIQVLVPLLEPTEFDTWEDIDTAWGEFEAANFVKYRKRSGQTCEGFHKFK